MIKTMKLNLRPNHRKTANSFIIIIICLHLATICFNHPSVTCLQLIAPNEGSRSQSNLEPTIASFEQQENNPPINETKKQVSLAAISRPEVNNLRLTSDYRAVKLNWTFQHNESNRPAAFSVRYCELTSWNIEIKCRHKDLKVEDGKLQRSTALSIPVIQTTLLPVDTVFHLNPPNGQDYEAQIFDLRALTNYTFQVRVARFAHEPEPEPPTALNIQQLRKQRVQAARRLAQDTANNHPNELASRIETKAFTAEATKCLADVSEVLVNTGRYFGGRISVENSIDPRCNILGNRSSEQTSYLFKINHEICKSKLVDGSRIETMVLVHENKDILTHNTARFLVLCNFLQKSFTLKASVSLPKVNGLIAPASRPAVISSLDGGLTGRSQMADVYTTAVTLGSMSGIYRARVPPHSSELSVSSTASNPLDELESNTIAKSKARKFLESLNSGRQAKELDSSSLAASSTTTRRRTSGLLSNSDDAVAVEDLARSLTLSPETSNAKLLPKPVQVQSKVLYVERPDISSSLRSGRQHLQLQPIHLTAAAAAASTTATTTAQMATSSANQAGPGKLESKAITKLKENSLDSADPVAGARTIIHEREERTLKQLANLGAISNDDLAADLQATPIIMTNNHRVAGNFLQPLAGSHSLPRFFDNNNQYSIKYSAAKVDEYPFVSASRSNQEGSLFELNGSQIRSRTGRMRVAPNTENERSTFSDLLVTANGKQTPTSASWTVNRMGDTLNDGSDLLAESSNETSNYLPAQQFNISSSSSSSSLAQNITNYLLKWSLKTITNLARKSIESLIKTNETEFSSPLSVSTSLSSLSDDQLNDLPKSTQTEAISDTSATPFPLSLSTTKTTEPASSSPSTIVAANLLTGLFNDVQGNRFTESDFSAPTTSSSTASSMISVKASSSLTSENSKSEEKTAPIDLDEVLDDFITNRRNQDEDSKSHPISNSNTNINQKSSRQHLRPSNYSKSLDFSRGDRSLSTSRQRANSENSSKVSKNIKQQQPATPFSPPSATTLSLPTIIEKDQSSKLHYNEDLWNNKDSFYSSWIFYSMLLLVALVIVIFLSFYFVSSSSSLSSSSSSQCLRQNNSNVQISSIRPIVGLGASCSLASSLTLDPNRSFRIDSYQRHDYNKLENYFNETLNSDSNNNRKKEALFTENKLVDPLSQHRQKSLSSISDSTRGTSVDSTASNLLVSENDCKNNELLYTEHVLINSGSSFGESYA